MICGICRERASDEIRYGNIPMCNGCWEKEDGMSASNMSPEVQMARVRAHNEIATNPEKHNAVLEMSNKLDNSIRVSSDIFNAKTQAIIDLKAVIDADENITNKAYALAETIKARHVKITQVNFEHQAAIMDGHNEQYAIQSYLNTLANQLKTEEREKLKLQDIKYQPNPVKLQTVKPIKTTGTTRVSKAPAHRQKVDKAALAKFAKELGVPEYHLQQIIVGKGCSVEEAAEFLKGMLAKMRGE